MYYILYYYIVLCCSSCCVVLYCINYSYSPLCSSGFRGPAPCAYPIRARSWPWPGASSRTVSQAPGGPAVGLHELEYGKFT